MNHRYSLGSVYLVVFLDMLGFGLIIPIMRDLSVELIKNSQWTLDPVFFSGLFMGAYSLFQFLFAPLLGRLSDAQGRKPVLLISVAGNVLSYLLWYISGSALLFLISRIVSGATGANIAVAQSYIADVRQGKERAKAMGAMGALLGLGFVLGPYLGGVASEWDASMMPIIGQFAGNSFSAVGLIAMFLSLLNLLWILVTVRETVPQERTHTFKTSDLSLIASVFFRENIGRLFVLYFFFQAAFVFFESTLAWDLKNRFGQNTRDTGNFFAYLGVLMILVQGGVYRRMVDKLSTQKIIFYGALFAALSMLFMVFSPTIVWFSVAIAFFALGMGLGNPSMSSLVSFYSSEDEQGMNLGIMQSLGALTRFAAPLVGTTLYMLHSTGAYWISFVFFAVAFGLARMLRKEEDVRSS